jgi:hypothetical protein
MASFRDVVPPLDSTGANLKGLGSSQTRYGPAKRGTRNQQLFNVEITKNKVILAEDIW